MIKLGFLLINIVFGLVGYASQEEVAEGVPEQRASSIREMEYREVITKIPESSLLFLKKSFSKESIWPWVGIISSTTLFYLYDEEILLEVQRWGRRWGLGNKDKTKTMISVGEVDIFRGPTDLGSSLYFLGDGWLHIGLALAFTGGGEMTGSSRFVNTGLQMLHGMVVSTVFNQFLKRTTGRESPFVRTKPRGAWRPFPTISEYNNRVPRYDAFPSGHVMTATTTFTILNINFPEYSHIIKPVEFVWVTLLGLQMLNNGVHWASDYPLGIAMGYLTGHIVTRYGFHSSTRNQVKILPTFSKNTLGLEVSYRF